MLSKAINLAIVDDHTLLRKTLKNYISEQRNVNVVIQSPDIPDFLSKVKDFCVHVLVMDIFMPEPNGIEAVQIIKNLHPDIKVLILTMCMDMNLLSDLIEAGVYGIISKADEPEELDRAILSLSEQRIYRSKLFTEVMYWNKQNNTKSPKEAANISINEREHEILQLLWEEKSNKEIAGHLYLSVRSVEKIRQHLKEKLGVKSTIGLIKYGINKKIIRVNSPLHKDSYFLENALNKAHTS
jgi:DNA-binding NarL/FixJ family response regulator